MQSMPDAEVGHILTNLFSGGRPRQGLSPPRYSHTAASQPQVHSQNVHGDGQVLTPASSASTPHQTQKPERDVTTAQRQRTDSQERDYIYTNPRRVDSNSPPPKLWSEAGILTPVGGSSNGAAAPSKRSRSRPTKSCEECRRKKLRCDRELPCSNCKKGGRDGSHCHFKDVAAPAESAKRVRVEEAVPVSRENEHQRLVEEDVRLAREQRFFNLPSYLKNPTGGPGKGIMPFGAPLGMPSDPKSSTSAWPFNARTPMLNWGERQDATSERERSVPAAPVEPITKEKNAKALGRVHIKGSKSRYIGIGDRMSMLDQFEDSKSFIMKSFKDSDMSGMIHELAAYQNAFSPKHKPRHALPYDSDELMVQMMKALPSGLLFGILQARYISNWETIWRVLHIDTFMKQCDQISELIKAGSFTLPPHIPTAVVPQILAIISTASRLYDPNDRGSTTTPERISEDQISKNCQMVKAWLDSLQGKALVEFSTLQTKALLLLAREANLVKPQELWVASGELIRHAMLMGLHQDPEPFEELSPTLKEHRRKLWMTIVELDLQFSLASGMPSALNPNAFNMRDLVNVDDQDLTEDMTVYPPSNPLIVWTHALPQIALGASIRERLQIVNMLGGNIDLEKDAPLLLHHAAKLEKALLDLPTQFRASTRAGNTSNKRICHLFTSINIDVAIRHPLIAIYRTISVSPLSSRYPEARKGALKHALAILGHIDALDPSVADLNIVKTREYLNLFHILRKSDILQSVAILCHEIRSYNTSSANSSSEPSLEHGEEDSIPRSSYSLTRVVENTLKSFIERLGEFGSDLKDILPVSVALQAVRSDGTAEEKKKLMVKGAERVLDACRRVRPEIGVRYREEVDRNGGVAVSSCGEKHSWQIKGQGQGQRPSVVNPFWNIETGRKVVQTPNTVVAGYDDYMIPDDNLHFENLDFGFFEWGLDDSLL